MTAIWKINRPSFFPSEEELAADQTWLDGYALLEEDLDLSYVDEEDESVDALSLDKRKKKPNTTTSQATSQTP